MPYSHRRIGVVALALLVGGVPVARLGAHQGGLPEPDMLQDAPAWWQYDLTEATDIFGQPIAADVYRNQGPGMTSIARWTAGSGLEMGISWRFGGTFNPTTDNRPGHGIRVRQSDSRVAPIVMRGTSTYTSGSFSNLSPTPVVQGTCIPAGFVDANRWGVVSGGTSVYNHVLIQDYLDADKPLRISEEANSNVNNIYDSGTGDTSPKLIVWVRRYEVTAGLSAFQLQGSRLLIPPTI